MGDDDEQEDDDGGNSSVQLIVIIVGAIATVIAVVLISIYAKRALNKVLQEDMDEDGRIGGGSIGEDVEAQDGMRPAVLGHAIRAQSTA